MNGMDLEPTLYVAFYVLGALAIAVAWLLYDNWPTFEVGPDDTLPPGRYL